MVLSLSKSINGNLDEKDVKDIHRIQSRKVGVKNTPIIVDFGPSIIKTDFLQKCKTYNIKNKVKLQAKHLGFTNNEDTPVFISEHLTAKGNRLYFLARDLTKTKQYKFCWTAFGRVFVKRDESSRSILIKSETQRPTEAFSFNELVESTISLSEAPAHDGSGLEYFDVGADYTHNIEEATLNQVHQHSLRQWLEIHLWHRHLASSRLRLKTKTAGVNLTAVDGY